MRVVIIILLLLGITASVMAQMNNLPGPRIEQPGDYVKRDRFVEDFLIYQAEQEREHEQWDEIEDLGNEVRKLRRELGEREDLEDEVRKLKRELRELREGK